MSKYQSWLIEHIKNHSDFIQPEIRKNEILGFLREPLEDLCITRPRSRLAWGIDYPSSPEHVVYVWFDALINYVSAVGFTTDEKKFKAYWPADVNMVGKDILRQHAVYWPIMLKACGVEPPKKVLAHGWWTLAGAKVSKSRGNAVDTVELVKKYGVDALRYFFLNEVTIGNDGAFSEDLLAERYRTDLANNLGNLWFRVASMLERYFEGKTPKCGKQRFGVGGGQFADSLREVAKAMEAYDPRAALTSIWNNMTFLNQKIEEKKPWVMAKNPAQREELAGTLVSLTEWVAHQAVLLIPFLPETSRKILQGLKLPLDWRIEKEETFVQPFVKEGTKIERGEALFPRLEEIK